MLLTLQSLSFEGPLKRNGDVLVLAELVLPRPAIARRSALLPLNLRSGTRSLARAPFYERALLKERVDGAFGLKVSVTRPHPSNEMSDFLVELLAAGIDGLGATLAPILLTQTGLRPALRKPFREISDRLTDDAPDFIAGGGLDLDSEGLKSGEISIPLHLTKALRQNELPPGPKSREKRRTKTKTFRKGSSVGTLILQVTP